MRAWKRIVVWAAVGLWPAVAFAASLTPEEASKHVGQTATVCGTVASANYAARSRGQPTFLNLDQPYPHAIFTAVIWGENRAAFGQPEQILLGKHVCVTGAIQLYRGEPEVILQSASQLTAN